ncbi:receptor-like protein kinase FERONIA [Abrus precatorius]|uniref:Receptor-like protein kinase FERONIA n=1 Tax=Abrus precatorius TaxID=3816 RepID=A0A8B8KY50_ABRPR|nr:receptor-like protein kinase FERONIA [Abrus precatorius]
MVFQFYFSTRCCFNYCIQMGPRSMRIATETTVFLLLLLLCLSYVSTAQDIYHPAEHFTILCGSSTNLYADGGRNWTGDNNMKLLSENNGSVSVPAPTSPTIQGPYTSARLSRSQFTYSFPVTQGQKFLRLFFYSTSYQNFDRHAASFSVKSGKFTLLKDFNASLHADAEDNDNDILFREYCINVQDGERLNITFIPSTKDNSYAFINGIEIVSMPDFLYYTRPNDDSGFPQLVGHNNQYQIVNNYALENKYRLRVGGREIPPFNDTGMFRTWQPDDKYLTTKGDKFYSADIERTRNLSFTKATPEYDAPDEVYRTVRNMGPNPTSNMEFNLTWQLPVDLGFSYLLRLHFCQLDWNVDSPGDVKFYIFVADQLATDDADVLLWTKNKGVPVVKDYVVSIPPNNNNSNLSLKLHPHPTSLIKDATLNAIELFKINDSTGSLAEPNPYAPPQTSQIPSPLSNRETRPNRRILADAVAAAVSCVVLLSCIVALFFIKRRRNVVGDKGFSKRKHGTSRGSASSSLPTNLCRHFSIAEIRAATNNFDELFVVGVGGFGNVYKGYIDNGSTRVAIKRLKPGSQQGAHEFMNEIEMLSQLRHLHLVSLIGYCYESNEMILVYDFMDRGTLRDHLYDTDNPSLSWKQRLKICIGAARGLHYLHTGAKHMIIHRDVKSTNILLDEKWVAKVSDFGLSRIGPTGTSMTHVSTQVKGSVGYLDPEYYKRQRLTEKSDVYSFGVVLLEVLSGRQPLLRTVEKHRISLVDWAKRCFHLGTMRDIVDPTLKGEIGGECFRKFGEIALNCLLEDGSQRPSMNDVVGGLEFVLQLAEYNAVKGVVELAANVYEDSDATFSSSQSSTHVSDYSKSTGFSTTSDGDGSIGSKESHRLISGNVFSEIMEPKGR